MALPIFAQEQIIPAGSILQCSVAEKISSMVDNVGDPILCHVTRSPGLPYNTTITGQFAEYQDPGHFVGKGWMELTFDRLLIHSSSSLSMSAKVIDVRGYRIDKQGRILGKGHATRDAVMWSIPILWPIDLLMLPGRGPRPKLEPETHLTVKLMDDLAVPYEATQQHPSPGYGFTPRPSAALQQPPQYAPGYAAQPYPTQPPPQYYPAPTYQTQPPPQYYPAPTYRTQLPPPYYSAPTYQTQLPPQYYPAPSRNWYVDAYGRDPYGRMVPCYAYRRDLCNGAYRRY